MVSTAHPIVLICGLKHLSFCTDVWSYGILLAQLVASDTMAPYGPGKSYRNLMKQVRLSLPEGPASVHVNNALTFCVALQAGVIQMQPVALIQFTWINPVHQEN